MIRSEKIAKRINEKIKVWEKPHLSMHGGKTISPGVFFSILKDLSMSEKDFWNMF